jgi:hypothetical protein
MAEFNFADRYRAAGLTPGPEVLALRQEPFDKLRKAVDAKTAVELSRIYFGLPTPNGTDWFRDPFYEADKSFSMLDNQRETALLAAGLLDGSFKDGKALSGIVPLAAAAFGLRKPTATPELLSEFDRTLAKRAISVRQREHGDPAVIKHPAKSKLPADAGAFGQSLTNDWNKIGATFKQVSDESIEADQNLANQVASVVKPMHADVADLREEVAMLWWHLGGWSRVLETPFADMPPAAAAAMAGLDMADLSRTFLGPVAAPAILHRTISVGRKAKLGKVTIQEAVDGLPDGALDKLDFGAALATVPDICPVLTAFAKAREIGSGTAWNAAFKKASGLKADAQFQTLDLAVQVFRERMTLVALR